MNNRNIPLTITINANAVTVAEHVISMMFCFNKKIHLFDQSVRENEWDKLKIVNKQIITLNTELFKKTIFILGFGRIGKELAKRCLAFEMQVLVFDPYVTEKVMQDYDVKKINLIDEGISSADYLIIHMPLNDDTKNLININNLKKNEEKCFYNKHF